MIHGPNFQTRLKMEREARPDAVSIVDDDDDSDDSDDIDSESDEYIEMAT